MKGEQQVFTIDFEPVGRRGAATNDDTILAAAQDMGVELVSLCGGVGACDSCKVRIATGHAEPPTLVEESLFSDDELAAGWRLACQVNPLGDLKVEIPPESLSTPQRLQLDGEALQQARHNPAVIAVDLEIVPPSLHDLRSDSERMVNALRAAGFDQPRISRPVMASASSRLRKHGWAVRLAVQNGEIVAVLPKDSPLLGLAVDIGTTSIAAYLVDLPTGEVMGKSGAMNPQIAYGEDVISRILYINDHENGDRILQERIVEEINKLAISLVEEIGLSTESVVDAVIVGNTAMHHIFAGLPVRQLGEAPYVPSVGGAFSFPARQVGLATAPGAYVYMPPNIAGYVGADHVSMQAAVDLWHTSQTILALDIGTNTEVTLVHEGHSYCCSCASGPAFEGAHISAGMRAAPGAIERVQWVEDRVLTQTIGDRLPIGICGSGILDSIAIMIEGGIINERGAFVAEHSLVSLGNDGKLSFILVPASNSANEQAIAVNRKDVAEIQLAKGAIRAGIEILLSEAGISASQIEQFIVAGAFGTYIDVESAIRVGMFPDMPLDRFRQVGNAAGMGAVQFLLSAESRHEAAVAVANIDYIELTTYAAFQNEFIRFMTFSELRTD
jgi:uncharacterized 2Fe-2S/4Fe-4S cluster protein (DUF4445 family)